MGSCAQRVLKCALQTLVSRVNGTLAVARAMGDFSFKREKKMSAEEQQVTCDPEIRKFGLERNDEFLILACDGIWDVMTSQEAVDFVGGKIKEGKELKQILSDLFDHCLSPHPSANEVSAPPAHEPLAVFPRQQAPGSFARSVARACSLLAPGPHDRQLFGCMYVWDCVNGCMRAKFCFFCAQGLGCDNMTAIIVKFKH